MTRNHDLLGVHPGASNEELKKAYREMIKVWHPDRFANDADLQRKAELKLLEINRAFEELTRDVVAADANDTAVGAASHTAAPAQSSGRGPWFLVSALVLLLGVPAAYWAYDNIANRRAVGPTFLSQESAALSATGVNRYLVNDVVTKDFFIIEGPRVPLDWEIDALVKAYTGHSPRMKQSVGSFTISQTKKPGDKDLKPLQYHSEKH